MSKSQEWIQFRGDLTVLLSKEEKQVAFYDGSQVKEITDVRPDLMEAFYLIEKGCPLERLYKDLGYFDASLLIQQLRIWGYVTDQKSGKKEEEMYSDQERFYEAVYGSASIRQKISQESIAVIGVGGLGSEILRHLVSAGSEDFFLIDPDVVSVGNLNRQFLFSSDDLGKPKVEIAASAMGKITSKANFKTAQTFITKSDQLEEIFPQDSEPSLIVCCADMPIGDIEIAVIDYCIPRKTTCVFVGMHLDRGYWGPLLGGRDSQERAKEFFFKISKLGRERAAIRGSSSFNNSMLASILADDLIRYLGGVKEPRSLNKLWQVKFEELSTSCLHDFETTKRQCDD